MTDIVDPETRHRMMSGIRGKNTKIEVLVRKGLFAKGFRYRINDKNLPGKPDIVLPKYKAVIFTHGCFWHGHDCHLFKWPSTRPEWWRSKIGGNRERDNHVRELLEKAGWKQCHVWECALKGKYRLDADNVIDELVKWLQGNSETLEIRGRTE